jgi:hypothetical protein
MNIANEISAAVRLAYAPPVKPPCSFSVERMLGTGAVRYYSLGRHALVDALRMLKVGPGDRVALPEFICKDLLASVAAVGASAHYYPVDEQLFLACDDVDLAGVKVIIAVNFFGFPQDMSQFEAISRQTGAVIIEDNAHGFLSRDTNGTPLGRRAPIGIFSLRKTVPVSNGAALVVNDAALLDLIPAQIEISIQEPPRNQRLKQSLRQTVPVIGIVVCRMMTVITRMARRIKTGHAIQPTPSNSETLIPAQPVISKWALDRISQLDELAEISRRRKLYRLLSEVLSHHGAEPIFRVLPEGTSPYVFPFRAQERSLANIHKRLGKIGLECHRWPDLPEALGRETKEHYSNVWMVPFLW